MQLPLLFLCLLVSGVLFLQKALAATPPNAVIYEDASKGGVPVFFRTAPHTWDNLKRLLRVKGLSKLAHICVNGTFLLYQSEGFFAHNEDQIRLLSGKNTCLPPGKIKSLQAISPKGYDLPMIAIFGEPLLQGKAMQVYKSEDIGMGVSGDIRSFVIQGKEPWSVVGGDGKTYCFKPDRTKQWPLCMMLDLEHAKINTRWVKVIKGCAVDPKMTTIKLQNCRNSFGGKLEKLDTSRIIKEVKSADQEEDDAYITQSPISSDCSKNKNLLKTLQYVQFNEFDSPDQQGLPKNKQLLGILYSMELSFDLMIEMCGIVTPKFLQMVRELFVEKLEDLVWSKQSVNLLEKKYNAVDPNLDKHLTDCAAKLRASGKVNDYRRMAQVDLERKGYYFRVWEPRDFPPPLKWLAGLPCRNESLDCPKYNSMQEVVNMVFNTVAGSCHIALQFRTNFFHDFALAFKSFYIDPLTDYWTENRLESMKQDQVIFGGLNVQDELKGLGICAGNVFREVPNLEMFLRDDKLSDPLRRKK